MREKIGSFLVLMVCAQVLVFAITTLFFNVNTYIEYAHIAIIYLVIALLLWLEKKNLNEFNFDQLSLVILILSSVFRRRLGVEAEGYFLLIIGAAGLAILINTISSWSKIPKTNFRWIVAGLFIACLSLVPITLIASFQSQPMANDAPETRGVFWDMMRRGIYDLSFTAPIEEVLFRGFIWGYLRRLKWTVSQTFWIQGVFFWFLHINRIGSFLAFFLSIPILTYVSSELTRRSNQLSPAIISHLVINVYVSVLLLT